jgi:hypothetical protein
VSWLHGFRGAQINWGPALPMALYPIPVASNGPTADATLMFQVSDLLQIVLTQPNLLSYGIYVPPGDASARFP